MKKAKLELVEQTEVVSLYSIRFIDENLTEFERFLKEFKDNSKLNKDFQRITYAISKILGSGAYERQFRPEGKFNDNVCAVPLTSGCLRLYCLRMSDQILIVGNGGIKNTATYEEDPILTGYVITLQKFEKLIKNAIKKGTISIEEKEIVGIENKIFEI